MEKILSIEDTRFGTGSYRNYDGCVITTSEQVIKCGINNNQQCCENWGYLMSHDNIDEFIGANLLSVSIVDELLNKSEIEETRYLDEGSTMFINFETSNGLLQFVAYNSHNGYYGHTAVLISKELNYQEVL